MNEKNKNILLAILIVGIISMTVAFAALTTNLKLQGTANVAETRWNIHFQNWALDTQNTVDGHQNTAEYPQVSQLIKRLSPNITKIENLNVTLKQPGDYVKYTFEIVNESTIDATLSVFNKDLTCNNNKDCSHIGYTITCLDEDDQNVEVGSTLEVNESIYCTLEVKYKNQTNTQTPGQNQQYTQEEVTSSLSADFQYVQRSDAYTYRSVSGTSSILPTGKKHYIKINNFTNQKEVCGVYPNGTVCIEATKWDGSNGSYVQSKISELEDAGAHCYFFNGNENFDCYDQIDMECGLNSSGQARCYDNTGSCYLNDDGSFACN